MNKRKCWISLALLLASFARAFATGVGKDEADLIRRVRSQIEDAEFNNSAEKFDETAKLLDTGIQVFPDSGLLLHYRGYMYYRQSAVLHGDAVLATLKLADESLRTSLKWVNLPETHAVRAIVLSRMIPYSPQEVMHLSQESGAELAKALEEGPENPRVWLIKGMITMFTPEAFGGGPAAALADLDKAEKLFVHDHPAPLLPKWGGAEVHAWKGIVYARKGDRTHAELEYRRALESYPGFPWVKYVLYPNLMDKKDPFAERTRF